MRFNLCLQDTVITTHLSSVLLHGSAFANFTHFTDDKTKFRGLNDLQKVTWLEFRAQAQMLCKGRSKRSVLSMRQWLPPVCKVAVAWEQRFGSCWRKTLYASVERQGYKREMVTENSLLRSGDSSEPLETSDIACRARVRRHELQGLENTLCSLGSQSSSGKDVPEEASRWKGYRMKLYSGDLHN